MDDLRQRIVQALQVLIGMPLWAVGRAYTIVWFQFGDKHEVPNWEGGTKTVGTYALHTESTWRIMGPEGMVVGTNDLYYRAGEDPRRDLNDFDWAPQGANRLDERLGALIKERANNPLVVQAVDADHTGGFRLGLADGYSVEMVPITSVDVEHWRLFQPGMHLPHFIVRGRGIEN